VNRSQGDASLFNALYDAYRQSPDVTRTRMYLETMTEILPNVEKKIIIDEELKGLVPLLNLNGAPTQGGK
jgi:modulator of FtsH protease HflK